MTQRGQAASAVTDSELAQIRRDVGAVSVSEKVLATVLGKMLGRLVIVPTPEQAAAQQVIDPNNPNAPPGTGGSSGGLPAGGGGLGAGPGGGGGPRAQGAGS